MRRWIAVLAIATSVPGRAQAEPAPSAGGNSAAAAPASPVVGSPAPAASPAGFQPTGRDSSDADRAYDQAFDALARGDRASAARLFDEAAAATADPIRRETAIQMGRRARLAAAEPRARELETSGSPRSSLLAGSTLLGLATYGWMVPMALEADEGSRAGGLYLLTASAAFVVPYVATRGAPIGWGTTNMWLWGSTRGFLHGYLVGVAFGCGEDVDCSGRRVVGTMLAGSLVEGAGGAYLAQRTGLSAGAARTIGTGGDFGLLAGFGVGVLAQVNEMGGSDAARGRSFAALSLAGAAGGALGGAFLARHRDYSMGAAEVMRTSGFLGIAAAALPLVWTRAESEEAIAGTLMAGAAAGLVLGDRLVRGKEYTYGQALIVDLGTMAGSLTALGLSLVLGGSESPDALATGGVAGAIAGFILTNRTLGMWGGARAEERPSVSLQLVPMLGPREKGLALAARF